VVAVSFVPWQIRVALDAELFRYRRLGFERLGHRDVHSWPLIVAKKVSLSGQQGLGGSDIVARVPMTLPVVFVQGYSWQDFRLKVSKELEEWPTLASCSISPEFIHDPIVVRGQSYFNRSLGKANAPRWDGTHEGLPLFNGLVLS
jgi:hypothetical protein